ncbi:MAG: SDR family oxidoreductase, partial [Pirellulaceae bacterium]
ACALAFARAGAMVCVVDINEEEGHETVRMVTDSHGRATFFRTDVSSAPPVEALLKHVIDSYGRLDYAVNNAGIEGTLELTADATEDNWDRVMAVNLKSVWLCMKQEIPAMLKQGGGAIVNVSSAGGLRGVPGCGAYVASKHGVLGLTKTAAIEYGKDNIRVNAVCPGVTRTEMAERIESQRPGIFEPYINVSPISRKGMPEEVAESVLWLCSDAASFITGTAIPIDGGYGAG